MKTTLTRIIPLIFLTVVITVPLTAQKANRYWRDTFDTTAGGNDINFEYATRQDIAVDGAVTWSTNSASQATDYHQQVLGGFLQLAGDGDLTNVLASPDQNFNGTYGPAPVNVIGKKVSLVMNAFTNPGSGLYTQAIITVGSSSPLAQAGQPGSGFSVFFIEDSFFGNGNFIQVWDGDILVGNNIPNPAGAAAGILEIFIDDPADGNPWDGTGSSVIIVKVNGTEIIRYQKAGGGYTSNYITLEGVWQSVIGEGISNLALHQFDGLTVFRFPDNESTLDLTAFESWALANGLGVYPAFGNDSDLDGILDGEEFAVDSDPLDSADSGKIRSEPVTYLSAQHMSVTLPVRSGAVFSGTPSPTATIDGIIYNMSGSTDLNDFTTEVIEVTPPYSADLPALNAGYEYRSFLHAVDIPTLGKGFLRVNTGPVLP